MAYKNDNVKKLIFIVFLFLLLLVASSVFAQEFDYPDLPGAQAPQDFLETAEPEDIPGLWVKYVINLATWSAGMIALLALIWGGIKFLTSTGKPDKITEARKQISSAFLGLAIILTAYFVLETISPYFINFTLPNLEEFSLINVPVPPSEKEQASSIDTYIPFGRIIENIFQTYISNPEEAEQTDDGPVVPETLTRIQRILNALDAADQLLPPIAERTSKIRDLSRDCECWWNTTPDPRCTGCGSCPAFPPLCTCDPCDNERNDIVNTEEELNPYLFDDIEGIYQYDAYELSYTITTNLTTEITKLEKEVRLLKAWFDRLARAQKFIEACDWVALNNRNQFFQKKDEFEAKGWVIEDVAFYDDLEVVLNVPDNPTSLRERWFPRPGTQLKEMADESTLYCAVGGTYVRQPSDYRLGLTPPDPFENISDNTIEDYLENEALFTYELACDITIPFGEILDKAHRIARLLVNNLELILDREKRIVEATGELQRLVSLCSSRMCFPLCICIPPPVNVCIEVGCFGPACPRGDIGDEARNIEQYVREIQAADTVIRQIFNQAPDLLQGMQDSLRNHMTKCTFEREVGADVVFYTCDKAIGGTDEIGKMIRQCDPGTNDEWQDTLYGGCLNNCMSSKISSTPSGNPTSFFEETDYRYCVSECMASVCIYNYNHELNFHCCHYKK